MHDIFIVTMPLPSRVSIYKLKGIVFSLSLDTWTIIAGEVTWEPTEIWRILLIKASQQRGTRMVQFVNHLPLAQVVIRVLGSSPGI